MLCTDKPAHAATCIKEYLCMRSHYFNVPLITNMYQQPYLSSHLSYVVTFLLSLNTGLTVQCSVVRTGLTTM